MTQTESVRHVEANGIRHALHEYFPAAPVESPGFAGRRTILLLHGFLDSGATFDLVAPWLCRAGYQVVAPDLRGFGDSERIPKGGYYHFPDYVADVRDLARAIDPEWLGVVGHSMGGGVASRFTGVFPDRVQKLVLAEGLGPMSEPPELAVDRMRRWFMDLDKVSASKRSLASLEEATDRLAASHPRIDRAILATRASRLTRVGEDGKLCWAWDPLHRTASPTPFFAGNFASFLRAITCPVLFVGGGPHGWHPPDEEERLAHVARLERVELPGAGHMMHWTAPEAFATAILKFFADG